MRSLALITGLVLLVSPLCSWSQTDAWDVLDAQFANALDLSMRDFEQAREQFLAAARGYAALAADRDVDPGLMYANAGNAYMLGGQTGHAVYAYRCALRHYPWLSEVRHNLAYARRHARDLFPGHRLSIWNLVGHPVTVHFLSLLFLAVHLGFWITVLLGRLLTVRPWFTALRRVLLVSGTVIGLAGLIGLVSPLMNREGVVVAEEVTCRTGNHAVYPSALSQAVHGGAEFVVLRRQEEWVQVRFSYNVTGWLPMESVRLFPPVP